MVKILRKVLHASLVFGDFTNLRQWATRYLSQVGVNNWIFNINYHIKMALK